MTFNKSLLTATLLTVAGLTAVSSANAVESNPTGDFNVTMEVQKSCIVTPGSTISLGTVEATIVPVDEIGSSFTVACSMGTPYTISMLPSGGNSAGIGAMAGEIADNTDTIAYQLTSDLAGTTPWTDESNGNSGEGMGVELPHTVFAKVTALNLATVKPDIYSETVTVSVVY